MASDASILIGAGGSPGTDDAEIAFYDDRDRTHDADSSAAPISMSKNEASIESATLSRVPAGEYARRFGANVLFGVGGRALQLLVGVFMLGYVVAKLGGERWGLVALSMSVATMLSLIKLGAAAGIGKRLNESLTRGDARLFGRYFSAGVLLSGVMGGLMLVVLALLLTVFWGRLNIADSLAVEGRIVFAAICLSATFTALSLPLVGCLQAVHRVDVNTKLQSTALLARAAAVVLVFELWEARASTYAIIILVANCGVVVGLACWVRRHVPEARLDFSGVDRALRRDVLGLNILTLFNSLNYVLFMQGPVLLLQVYGGLQLVGLYGIGLQVNNLVRGFLLPGVNAFSPVAVSLEASGRREEMRRLFVVATKSYVAIGMLMWVWFVLIGARVLPLWLSEDVTELVLALPYLIGAATLGIAAMPAAVVTVALERLRIPAATGVVLAGVMTVGVALVLQNPGSHTLMRMCALLVVFFGLYQAARFTVVARAFSMGFSAALGELVLRPLLPTAAAGVVLYGGVRWGIAASMLGMVLLTAAAGVVWLAALFGLLYNRVEREEGKRLCLRMCRRTNGEGADNVA